MPLHQIKNNLESNLNQYQKKALIHLKKSLAINAFHIPTLLLISEIYLKIKKYNEVDLLIKSALSSNLKSPELYFILSKKNLACQNFEKAIEYIDKAISKNNKCVKYYKFAIEIFDSYDLNHLSTRYLERIIDLSPNDGEAYYKLSKTISINDNLEKKIKLLETASGIIPNFHDAIFELGKLYFLSFSNEKIGSQNKENLIEKAKQHFSSLVNSDSFQGISFYNLGKIERCLKNLNNSIAFYKKAMDFDTSKGIASFQLGEVYFLKNNLKKSELFFNKALKSGVRKGNCFFQLGEIFLSKDSKNKAIECFKRAKTELTTEKTNLEFKSKKSAEVYDFDLAKYYLNKSIKVGAILSKAQLYIYKFGESKGFEDSIKLITKIIDMDYSNFDAHFEIGLVYLQMGQLKKAKNSMELACEINWEHVESHFELGKIEMLDKNFEKSKMHFQIVSDIQPNNNKVTKYLKNFN